MGTRPAIDTCRKSPSDEASASLPRSAGRLGGDEFAVLVPVARSRTEVEEIAERLERRWTSPFSSIAFSIQGSASVGIALYPEDGIDKDSLLNTADAAMYVAKHSTRQLD